jgi:hypothetical protein
MSLDIIPKINLTKVVMPILFERRTIQSSDSVSHPSADDVFVVTMQFGKCFFEKRHPKRVVIANISKDRLAILHWNKIINNLGEGDTDSIHVNCINSVLIDFILRADKKIFNSSCFFSKSAGS